MATALELLTPARDLQCALAALSHGADAIYIGGPGFGARSRAANSVEDIQLLCRAAKPFGVRIYVTLNTIVYPHERSEVQQLIWRLWRAGVDALIVQDTSLLTLDLPPIDLHASTQCDIRTPERARDLAALGMSRLVLPRELTMDEIRGIAAAVPGTEIEAFVHGALCVCYSGACRAGYVVAGRSANRGECPQLCRLPYTLRDGNGKVLMRDSHLLSLRDLNRSGLLGMMADAGVCSFKIEGRLKDSDYIKETTGAYSRLLDRLVASDPGRWRRASYGRSRLSFSPDLSACFNRGYTGFFSLDTYAHGRPVSMAGIDSPARRGTPLGTVIDARGCRIVVRLHRGVTVANGDGAAVNGSGDGFRINRVETGRKPDTVVLHTLTPADVRTGVELLRTADRSRARMLASDTAERTLRLNVTLRSAGSLMVLDMADECGRRVSVSAPLPGLKADKPQDEVRLRLLSRLGDTPWRLESLDDRLGDCFVPAALLTALRRRGIAWLMRLPAAPLRLRAKASLSPDRYAAPGFVEGIDPGILRQRSIEVMESRYCIRRECGHCLRTPQGREWPQPLWLEAAGDIRFRVDFDCDACRMHIHTP